eukprot:3985031-Alexandrium_andersonii.AAC.1
MCIRDSVSHLHQAPQWKTVLAQHPRHALQRAHPGPEAGGRGRLAEAPARAADEGQQDSGQNCRGPRGAVQGLADWAQVCKAAL